MSKDYSAVPASANWLVQNETFNLTNCNVENCYWPVGHVTSMEISEAKNLEQSWCTYEIKVLGGNKTYIEFQQVSSPSSQPISPWSTSPSSAVGLLKLESTCSSLIWRSVPSNTKSVQIFSLRNCGLHKEKLHLRIEDNMNCFKLISSGENQVSEMKLLLEPMESQKLSVALISTSNESQAYGYLILQRQNSNEKRVISLYGYCGHSVIVIRGPFEDNFGNMWLYPNLQLMTSRLSITNFGNTAAFVKIVQENSSVDIIRPDEFILKKGETANVEITIVMSPERLEMLIGQSCSSKVININKMSLIYGDEASRMRLSRLVINY
ncbi:hypothetical protein QTP88_003266 [Uroleucon formosanum]